MKASLRATQVRLDDRDRENVATIREVGVAKTTAAAIRYGLHMGARAAKRHLKEVQK